MKKAVNLAALLFAMVAALSFESRVWAECETVLAWDTSRVSKIGDTMTGQLNMSNAPIVLTGASGYISNGSSITASSFFGPLVGNADTATAATALAANGANCAASSFPLGVDASGAAESCSTSISGNAATATALAASGANCSAGQYPLGVDASGAVESCTAVAGASAGSIIQSTTTALCSGLSTTANIPYDNTKPQISEGLQAFTSTFTPTAAGSIIRISGHCYLAASGSDNLSCSVFRDSTADSIAAGHFQTASTDQVYPLTFAAEVPATAASATVFSVRFGGAAGNTFYMNRTSGTNPVYGGSLCSVIRIEEIKQ